MTSHALCLITLRDDGRARWRCSCGAVGFLVGPAADGPDLYHDAQDGHRRHVAAELIRTTTEAYLGPEAPTCPPAPRHYCPRRWL